MTKRKKSFLHRVTSRSRDSNTYFKLLEMTGKDLRNNKWIFILGCYNSGTTLLQELLSQSEKVSTLPDEGVMLTNKLPKPEDFGWRRMWWKCQKALEIDPGDVEAAQSIRRHWSHFYQDKQFLLEKSISNVCRIPFLSNNFRDSYFIHIVRNGYAVAEGIKRKAQIIEGNPFDHLDQYPIDVCITQWIKTLDLIEMQKGQLSNFIEISYEDLTENPELVINRLTNFIGLEKLNRESLLQSFNIHEKESPIKNMNNRSISNLSQQEIQLINKIAIDYFKKYNYRLL